MHLLGIGAASAAKPHCCPASSACSVWQRPTLVPTFRWPPSPPRICFNPTFLWANWRFSQGGGCHPTSWPIQSCPSAQALTRTSRDATWVASECLPSPFSTCRLAHWRGVHRDAPGKCRPRGVPSLHGLVERISPLKSPGSPGWRPSLRQPGHERRSACCVAGKQSDGFVTPLSSPQTLFLSVTHPSVQVYEGINKDTRELVAIKVRPTQPPSFPPTLPASLPPSLSTSLCTLGHATHFTASAHQQENSLHPSLHPPLPSVPWQAICIPVQCRGPPHPPRLRPATKRSTQMPSHPLPPLEAHQEPTDPAQIKNKEQPSGNSPQKLPESRADVAATAHSTVWRDTVE